jgi:hypothetical protein
MPADMTLYFDVFKKVQEQVNRITYAINLSPQDRLNQLNRLEHELGQKFVWARRSLAGNSDSTQAEAAADFF